VGREKDADQYEKLKETSEEYKVYDSHYEKIGKVDDLVVGEDERALYIGVKMGFFGTNSTLIPVEIARINERRRLVEVFEPAETIKHAPHFGKSEELTPELENHVRNYFGLKALQPSPEHEPLGSYAPDYPTEERFGPDDLVDTAPGERAASRERPVPPEGRPEESQPEPSRQPAREREPISERLSKEPGLMDRLGKGGSGVTVHRLRR
jgi:hypothetical protein